VAEAKVGLTTKGNSPETKVINNILDVINVLDEDF
jgi:hypothetical protein